MNNLAHWYGTNTPLVRFSRVNEESQKFDLPSSQLISQIIFILNPLYKFNVFQYIPRNFTINTNNGSYEFNSEMLKETSPLFNELINQNPTQQQYHLNINDDEYSMKKIEQLYSGEQIFISDDDQINFQFIIDSLKIRNKFTNGEYKVVIDKKFNSFLSSKMPRNFTILTKNKKYQCNSLGVNSSNVICEFKLKNPNSNTFKYEFDDEFDEFQPICDLFNFDFVTITVDNMNSLKSIAEELQIDFVLKDINEFIDGYEKRVKKSDDQQLIIESVNELFELLYKIKELTVESVKDKIIESEWSKTEENVQELAAFILQVVRSSITLQTYMVDLIELLDKESNKKSNKLEILIPFISNRIMTYIAINKSMNSFVFLFYKRGIIKKEEIKEELKIIIDFLIIKRKREKKKKNEPKKSFTSKNVNNDQYYYENLIFFLPEIFEILNFNMDELLKGFNPNSHDFILSYFPNDIDKFEKMRENGEPDDQITKALRDDDVDLFQSIVSKTHCDISKAIVPYNIYETVNPNGKISYINYSAFYGSVKCFKYLLLNHEKVDFQTLVFSMYGGNTEIIQIIDQRMKSDEKNVDDVSSLLSPAIIKHQYNLFDWIIDQKCQNIIQNKALVLRVLHSASLNGNLYSIVSLIDKGLDLSIFDVTQIHNWFYNASFNGFYKILKFMSIILDEKLKQGNNIEIVFDYTSSISFGNLSIFKFYYEKNKNLDLKMVLVYAVKMIIKDRNIIDYIFDNYFIEKINPNQKYVFQLLYNSIVCCWSDFFKYLIEKIKKVDKKLLEKFDVFYNDLLSEACYFKNEEICKQIIDLIFEQEYDQSLFYTRPFYNAAIAGFSRICQLLIDKKVLINFNLLSLQMKKLSHSNSEILDIIIKNIEPEMKDVFINCAFDEAIVRKNKKNLEFLLKIGAFNENALFNAVKAKDIEIVNMILNHNSEPSFINQMSKNGTALSLAVSLNDLIIVKRLLSIPGINPSLCIKNKFSPFVNAIDNLNVEIMDAILDFYGPKIQQWQINKGLKVFIGNYYRSNNSNFKSKYLDVLNRLLEIEYIDLNIQYKGRSLFSYACEKNEIDIVKIMLKYDKIDIGSCNLSNGFTPLMYAIDSKNIEIVKILSECDRININERSYIKDTPLTIAVQKKSEEIVDIIINNKKFDPVESRLDYAFYLSNGNISKKLALLEKLDVNYKTYLCDNSENNENKVNETKVTGLYHDYKCTDTTKIISTKLICAVSCSDGELIDLIVNHPSFDPVKSFAKNSVFLACKKDNVNIFKKLFKYINNDINTKNEIGVSLLEIAVENDASNMVVEILNNEKFDLSNINFNKIFIKSFSKSFETMKSLFDYDNKHEKIIDLNQKFSNGLTFYTSIKPKEYRSIFVEFLLNNGADPNIPDENGKYPLEYAIENSMNDYAIALINSSEIDFSVKINSKQTNANSIAKWTTYLHLAIMKRNDKIFTNLIQNKNVDINIVDSNGETPLMEACRVKNIEYINRLFTMNLDYQHCNNDGEDALKILQKITNTNNTIVDKTKESYCKCLCSMLTLKSANWKIWK